MSDQPDECMSCGFETKELECYPRDYGEIQGDHWLCELCANTRAGNALRYPRQYPNQAVLQAICYIGNYLGKTMDNYFELMETLFEETK